MKQAVMKSPGHITISTVSDPEPGPDEVLIRVKRIGVCGSDVHVWHGKHPYTSYPVVQGHEVSGIIEQSGSSLKKGTPVTFQPQVTCEKCLSCRTGQYHICDHLKVMGFQTTGAASELFCVPKSLILPLPEHCTLDQGALVEPLAVAVHALSRSDRNENKKVLVLGAGPVGNLTAQAAKASGADTVCITDLSDFRLKKAEECGILNTVNPKTVDLSDALIKIFGTDKADLILECTGNPNSMSQAVNMARKGTDIVVVGVFPDKVSLDIGLVQDRELRLIGTLMYQKRDYEQALFLLGKKLIQTDPLITHRFAFDDYTKAYELIDREKEKTMKVMIEIG